MKSLRIFFKKNSPFNISHSYFMGSAALVQFIPLVTAPIIARLYSPDDFGSYAVFFGIVAIISSISHLSLHNAILLAPSDKEAARAHLLALYISVLTTLLLSFIFFLIPNQIIINFFGLTFLKLLPWLPITLILSSTYVCFYNWWIRKNLYKELGYNQLILGITTAVVQISIGLTGLDAIGFVWANILGNVVAVSLLMKLVIKDMKTINHCFNLNYALRTLSTFKNLALFTTPAGLINSSSSYLPDFYINSLFGSNALGQYSLANRMVNMPLGFFSNTVQDIFRQQASQEFNEVGNCKRTFNQFFGVMFIVSITILIPFILILPYIFPIIFGNQWENAGTLIQPLILLISIRFISSPLSYIWIIKGHQRLDMFWQLGLLIITIVSFVAIPSSGIKSLLWNYSLYCGLWYGVCICVSFYFSRN